MAKLHSAALLWSQAFNAHWLAAHLYCVMLVQKHGCLIMRWLPGANVPSLPQHHALVEQRLVFVKAMLCIVKDIK